MAVRARPRITRELHSDGGAPDCPHCGADMDNAQTTLGSVLGGKIGAWVLVDEEGYASGYDGPRFTCPGCARESVLAIDADTAKLIGARSRADEAARKAAQ